MHTDTHTDIPVDIYRDIQNTDTFMHCHHVSSVCQRTAPTDNNHLLHRSRHPLVNYMAYGYCYFEG